MGRGMCSASLVALGFALLFCSAMVSAETYVVGDSKGWGLSVSYDSWSNGKPFAAGDTIVFNFQAGVHNAVAVGVKFVVSGDFICHRAGVHNAVAVGASEYQSCKVRSAADSAAMASGTAKFDLKKGVNYFICGVPGHCAAGMKLRVVAN